jgi:hypothetical protein
MSTPEERGNVRATKRNIVAHEYAQPRDPSLALCQICANAKGSKVYARSMDGEVRLYPTCARYALMNCNDFVPGNLERSTLQGQAEMMRANAQYGRWQL